MTKLRVGVVGCGLIGTRRASEAAQHPQTQLLCVTDSDSQRAQTLSQQHGCKPASDWQAIVNNPEVEIVVVSTPPGLSVDIAIAAMKKGKHVLVEKPPGKNLADARRLSDAARDSGKLLKIGFNHRYHPGIRKAYALLQEGTIGEVFNIRACYGHGGRPGYEKEWRGNPSMAGGGELTDQGVHIADLIHWFLGLPQEAFCMLQTASWPIAPLEDNAFALFRYSNGAVASLHTSWTQWKNRFSFELFGQKGLLGIEGLGGSYGPEKLVVSLRKPEGGAPEQREELFEGPDLSWQLEWQDFIRAVQSKTSFWGSAADGVAVMRMIAALYQSSQEKTLVSLAQTG